MRESNFFKETSMSAEQIAEKVLDLILGEFDESGFDCWAPGEDVFDETKARTLFLLTRFMKEGILSHEAPF